MNEANLHEIDLLMKSIRRCADQMAYEAKEQNLQHYQMYHALYALLEEQLFRKIALYASYELSDAQTHVFSRVIPVSINGKDGKPTEQNVTVLDLVISDKIESGVSAKKLPVEAGNHDLVKITAERRLAIDELQQIATAFGKPGKAETYEDKTTVTKLSNVSLTSVALEKTGIIGSVITTEQYQTLASVQPTEAEISKVLADFKGASKETKSEKSEDKKSEDKSDKEDTKSKSKDKGKSS